MRPDWSTITAVSYGCDDPDCDFGGDAKNGTGIAAQHAEATGHPVWADQVMSLRWNWDDSGEGDE